jgi:Fic family protein
MSRIIYNLMEKLMNPWIWQHPSWPNFTWNSSLLAPALARAHSAIGGVRAILTLLSVEQNIDVKLALVTAEGAATLAIEGEVVDAAQVRSSAARHLGLNTAGWPEPSRQIEGLVSVLTEAVETWEKPLTGSDLCRWQGALFPGGLSGFDRIHAGGFRPGPVKIVSGARVGEPWRVHYEAAPAGIVSQAIDDLLSWVDNGGAQEGLITAAVAHLWFEAIHPFEDGNGRVGRAFAERLLAQSEKSPLRIFSLSQQLDKVRNRYTDSLGAFNRADPLVPLDVTSWILFFTEQVLEASLTAHRSLDGVVNRARFWATNSSLTFNFRQAKAINAWLGFGEVAFPNGITNAKYASITQTSKATATRDLSELVQFGVFAAVPHKGGRSTAYRFVRSPWVTPVFSEESDKPASTHKSPRP